MKKRWEQHKLLVFGTLLLLSVIGFNWWLSDKEIVFRSPIQIRKLSPVSPEDTQRWREDCLEELIRDVLEEEAEPTPGPEARKVVFNTQLVSDHSREHPGVYTKLKEHFGEDAPIVGDLVSRESSMNPLAINSVSGACGLFQSHPCEKMGCDLNDIDCQVQWGKEYIEGRYGSPQGALEFWHRNGWF